MAKDARALRDDAAAATAAGKHKRALAAYLELERIESRDAQWAKRAGETYKRLGNLKHAIEAFERSVDRYAQNGFLVQAIAVCKLILQLDATHAGALQRLARMSEQVGQAPTLAHSLADNNPALHDNPTVARLRRATTNPEVASGTGSLPALREDASPFARSKPSTPPPVTMSRTKSKPISLPPGAGLDTVHLAKEVAESYGAENPGVHVIPIDDDEFGEPSRPSMPLIIELPEDEVEAEVEYATELDLEDIEEIPLGEPREIGVVAQRALAATPLFAGLPSEVLHALVAELVIVSLAPGKILFHEHDPSDALYVVVEGELIVQAEGPPRVEMSRLGPGSFIGEVALMTDQPRAATVSAATASELLRIDRNTLARVLASHGDMLVAVLRFVRDRLVERWMRTSPLFRPFDDVARAELAARFMFLEIEDETVLLGAGKKPDGLYIVLAGQFVAVREGAVVATLGPGDLIGETALLSGGAFRSDVVARGKSLALCLPAADFREVIMTHPLLLEYIGEQAEHSRRLQIL